MYKIKISDLRYLSHAGNATVKLDQNFNYQIGEIRRDGIYTSQIGLIRGKKTEIKMRESFVKGFPHILTIKQGRVLVAERRRGDLVATSAFERKLSQEKERVKKVYAKTELREKKER